MWESLNQILRGYQLHEVIFELAVIFVCVLLVFRFLKGTRGATLIKGVAFLLVVLALSFRVLGDAEAFGRLKFLYGRFVGVLTILLIVVFQAELRQAMFKLGHARFFGGGPQTEDAVIESVNVAVQFLSKSQFGAIIAIERDTKLGGLIDGGEQLDANISARLLQSIFWPNSPLHDLGVVVRGKKILAANVQFPMADDTALPQDFGSRHRAAIGVTLDADCLVIVVSEETGSIRLAEHGRLSNVINRDDFESELRRRLTEPDRDDDTDNNDPGVDQATDGTEPTTADQRKAAAS